MSAILPSTLRATALSLGTVCLSLALSAAAARSAGAQLPPPNFTVAFLGDQGLGSDSEAVLQMVKDEGAEAVVHAGDFDYDDDPQAWDDQINDILGPNFPYFAAVGNHDDGDFYGSGGYQEFLEARMNRIGVSWDGDLGVMSWHRYGGISFVLTAPDVFGDGDGLHDEYIRDQFAGDTAAWRVSCFHKNMNKMQVGGKGDEAGWGVYEESRRAGAIIATGHEHSYSRTHLMSDMDDQVIASTGNTLTLRSDDPGTGNDEGRTFAVVSGLAGKGIRDQERDDPWWASIYTSDQNANYGALFGVFNYQGDPYRAHFYFKDIDGVVVDDFFVETALSGFPGSTTTTTMPAPQPGEFHTRLLRVNRLGKGAGEQGFNLRSDEIHSAGVSYDPPSESVTLRFEADGSSVMEATIAAGDPGWLSTRNGYRWKGKVGAHPDGLTKVKIIDDGAFLRLSAKAKPLDATGVTGASELTVTLESGGDQWSGPTPPCDLSRNGNALRCR